MACNVVEITLADDWVTITQNLGDAANSEDERYWKESGGREWC